MVLPCMGLAAGVDIMSTFAGCGGRPYGVCFMNYRIARRAMGLAVLLVAAAACGPAPTTPTAPSVTTLAPLLLPRVGGLWGGPMTFTDLSGGTGIVRSAGSLECVGATFATVLGQSNSSSLQITQDGTKVEGRLTSSETGL